jgi:hypothetical protein
MSGPDLNDMLRADPETARRYVEATLARQARESHGRPNGRSGAGCEPHECENKPKRPFKLYADIDPEPRKAWLVAGLLGEDESSAFYGAPGSGKSVLVGDLACHVGAGSPWHGRKVTRGAVLYIALERPALVERRMAAFRAKHKLDNLPVAVMRGPINFVDPRDVEHVLQAIRELETVTGLPVALVAIDTVNRALNGGDENSAKDMGAFIAAVGTIQAAITGHVLVVHHVPLGDSSRLRGHGSLLGALDTTVHVVAGAMCRTATVIKANDSEEGERIAFTLESVELHRAEDETVTTAPVVVPVDAEKAAKPATDQKMSDRNRLALEILRDCIVESGEMVPASWSLPAAVRKAVSVEIWREALFRRGALDRDHKNTREEFRRIKTWLQARHLIAEQSGLVWSVRTGVP